MIMSNIDTGMPPKVLAQLFLDNNILSTGISSIGDMQASPEFQVLKLLTNFQELSDSEIEAKYQAPYSLSMILSNLSADQLIVQTGSYKWKISEKVNNLITNFKQSAIENIKEKELETQDKIMAEAKRSKKKEYKQIANALGKSQYVPNFYASPEELYDIAELELLVIIHKNQPISSIEIEKQYTNTSSLSLTLSNLKADNLIEEDTNYNWKLVDSFRDKLETIHNIEFDTDITTDEVSKDDDIHNFSTKINFIEHSQFIKLLLDMNYFKNLSLNQILDTIEFQILNVIYLKSPVSAEDIESEFSEIPSLAMILSNLSIDGLCEQDNEYKWKLSSEFRRNMMKIKVDKEEFMEEIRLLEQRSAKTLLKKEVAINEVITLVKEEKSSIGPIKESYVPPEKLTPSNPNDILQDILIKHHYMEAKQSSIDAMMQIPEFEVLKIISEQESISGEDIERRADASSISLTLSNLSADKLIEQTQDYKWRISNAMKKLLDPSLVKSQIDTEREEMEKARIAKDQQKEEEEKQKNMAIKKLASACRKKGYITDEHASIPELMSCSEFEILKIVQENQPVSAENIKSKVTGVSPVLITRTLSKLEADECLENDLNSNYIFSELFEKLLIEDELREKEERERQKALRREEEKAAKLRELESQFSNLSEILIADGYINPPDRESKTLMSIPEFEIIALLNKEGVMTLDALKKSAESVSPVLISRTISKLVADNMITRNANNELDLSNTLKSKIHRNN